MLQEAALLGYIIGLSDLGSQWGAPAEGGVGRSGWSGDFVPGSLPAGLTYTDLFFLTTIQSHSSCQVALSIQPSQSPGGGAPNSRYR